MPLIEAISGTSLFEIAVPVIGPVISLQRYEKNLTFPNFFEKKKDYQSNFSPSRFFTCSRNFKKVFLLLTSYLLLLEREMFSEMLSEMFREMFREMFVELIRRYIDSYVWKSEMFLQNVLIVSQQFVLSKHIVYQT